jgi:hypothetical protein
MASGRSLSEKIKARRRKISAPKVILYFAAVALLALVAKCTWYAYHIFPVVEVYGGAVSPWGDWVALTEYVEGPLAAVTLDNAVELRRFNEPFEYFKGQRVFLLGISQVTVVTGVRWIDHQTLVVTTRPFDPDRVAIQQKEYKGITIIYETEDSPLPW